MTAQTEFAYCHKGCIEFKSDKIYPGILSFGITDFKYRFKKRTVVSIRGKILIIGKGYHQFGEGGHMMIRKTGVLEVGNNLSIGRDWTIMVSSISTIGNNNMYSWDVSLFDTDGHKIFNSSDEIINYPKPFNIGNDVWISSGSTILKGSYIADGIIIASRSLVTKRLTNKRSVYIDNNCIKTGVTWSHENF